MKRKRPGRGRVPGCWLEGWAAGHEPAPRPFHELAGWPPARAAFLFDAQQGQSDTAPAAITLRFVLCRTEPGPRGTERHSSFGGESCRGKRIRLGERTTTNEQTIEETENADLPLRRPSSDERDAGG